MQSRGRHAGGWGSGRGRAVRGRFGARAAPLDARAGVPDLIERPGELAPDHYLERTATWLNTVVPQWIEVSVDAGGLIEVREHAGPSSTFLPGGELPARLWILLSEVQDAIQIRSHEQWPDPRRSASPNVDITDEGVTVGYTSVSAPILAHPAAFRTPRAEPWLMSQWIAAP